MNWLTNFVKPKLSALVKRKEVPENLWNNCPTCGNMIHHKDLRENLKFFLLQIFPILKEYNIFENEEDYNTYLETWDKAEELPDNILYN